MQSPSNISVRGRRQNTSKLLKNAGPHSRTTHRPGASGLTETLLVHHSHGSYDWRLGGARRDRTADLLLAKQALSQLSYGPAA